MTNAWMSTVYKTKRQQLLIQNEVGKIASSQVYIPIWKQKLEFEQQLREKRSLMKQLKADRDKLENAIQTLNIRLLQLNGQANCSTERIHILNNIAQVQLELDQVETLIRYKIPEDINVLQNEICDCDSFITGTMSTKRNTEDVFQFKCPRPPCKGILNTDFICGVCRLEACVKCHEARDTHHICDPNSIASVELLKSDSKPCPRCRTMIHRIMGCDQMWCTACHARFDWVTGKFYKMNAFHNPHLVEHLRKHPNYSDDAPQNDAPDHQEGINCNRLMWQNVPILGVLDTLRTHKPAFTDAQIRHIVAIVHLLKETCHTIIPKLLPRFLQRNNGCPRDDPNLILRLSYMMGDLSETDFGQQLFQREQSIMISNDYRELFTLYENVTNDILNSLVADVKNESTVNLLEQHTCLLDYINKTICDLNKKYKRKVSELFIDVNS